MKKLLIAVTILFSGVGVMYNYTQGRYTKFTVDNGTSKQYGVEFFPDKLQPQSTMHNGPMCGVYSNSTLQGMGCD